MFKPFTRIFVLSGVVTLTTAFGTVQGTDGNLLTAEKRKAPIKIVMKANGDFGWDLYAQLAKENREKNLFFSPYSILSALTMTAEGARGQTAREMGRVLRFPAETRRVGNKAQRIPWETAKIHAGMGLLNKQLNAPKSPHELRLANAL